MLTLRKINLKHIINPKVLSNLQRLYHENIIDHYENPRNVGSLDKNSSRVGKFILFLFLQMCV
jgi:hypothetical protein